MMLLELNKEQEEGLLKASLFSHKKHAGEYPMVYNEVVLELADKSYTVSVKVNFSNNMVRECTIVISGYKYKASKEFGNAIMELVKQHQDEVESAYKEQALFALNNLLGESV